MLNHTLHMTGVSTHLVEHIDQEAYILKVFNLAGELDMGVPATKEP